jgi:polysaccharide chain length determinant protein (PEP-CTERM system associated)
VRRQEAENRLEDLLLRYTDRHPEVVALRATIAELKAREQQEMQDINRGGAGSGAIRSLNANPVYQNIQLQLNQTEVEIASLQGAIAQHQREIANLKRMVDTAPEVERELARLTRDYGVTKTQYESLLQRSEQTKVSDDAQQTGIVKFEVLDPPLATTAPVWPDRPLLMAGVLAAGVLVGVGVAFIVSLLIPTFTNARNLSTITGVNVLGHVSFFPQEATDWAIAADRRRFVMVGAGLAAVGVLMLLTGSMTARLLQRLIS